MKPLSHQNGVALITALLIVALATIISVKLSTQLQLDVRRTANVLENDQALLYGYAAEEFARSVLRDDRLNNNIDHIDENWARELPPFVVEGGMVQGKLTDLQGCFNLNSLVSSSGDNPVAETHFRNLLANNSLNPGLAQSIMDWIDDDVGQTRSPDGAEDLYYMNLEHPYRAANTPLSSVSELRLIKGFEASETFDGLTEAVCAYSAPSNPMAINVNTAKPIVLQSLAPNLSLKDAETYISQRPYNDVQDFINTNKLTNIVSPNIISVSTNYFLLETVSIIGQASTTMYSIIYREQNGNTRIIARSLSAY